MTDRPSTKLVYNAIRNYLVNELGIDQEKIQEILVSIVEPIVASWLRDETQQWAGRHGRTTIRRGWLYTVITDAVQTVVASQAAEIMRRTKVTVEIKGEST